MIEEIITHINTQIDTLSYFNKLYGLCQIIEEESRNEEGVIKRFPAVYDKNDEWNYVLDFDTQDGTIYHRLTGEILTEEGDAETNAGDDEVIINYPLRTVFVVSKDALGTGQDDNYIDAKIAENIWIKVASIQNKTLISTLQAHRVEIYPESRDIDRYRVHRDETDNIDMEVGFDQVYGAIDYDIEVSLDQECLTLNT